ncbi:t-SNARE [Meredithblackwellia eburnea MCA 4105]
MNRLVPGGGSSGYAPIGDPMSSHIVGGPQKDPSAQDLEMGSIGSTIFYDEVAGLRTAIREFEDGITTLSTRHVYGLTNPSEELTGQVDQMQKELREVSVGLMNRVQVLGTQVGRDDAKRGHWDSLKVSLQRAVAKYQQVEMTHRERVKERVARQYKIVKPDATEFEIKEVMESSQQDQIFAQAVAGSRLEGAQAALSEAQMRRAEFAKLEETIIELSALTAQVAGLVASQDSKIITIEDTMKQVEGDSADAVKQLTAAKISAAAARHKRKLCAAFAGIILLILIIVIAVQVKQATGGSSSSDKDKDKSSSVSGTDTKTDAKSTDKSSASSATVSATATHTSAAKTASSASSAPAATSAPAVRW